MLDFDKTLVLLLISSAFMLESEPIVLNLLSSEAPVTLSSLFLSSSERKDTLSSGLSSLGGVFDI